MFKLQWHSPDAKYFKLWERLIGRSGFKVTKNTKVCSNHFVLGKPLGKHLHPELWLRGYVADKPATLNFNAAEVIETWPDVDKQDESVFKTTRKGTIKRKATHTLTTPTKRVKGKHDTGDSECSSFNSKAFQSDHTYSREGQTEICNTNCNCESKLCFKCKKEILHVYEENERLQKENQALKKSLDEATQVIEQEKVAKYSVNRLKDSDSLIKLHTGLDSYALFEWTYDQVKDKVDYLQYYKGPNSHTVKRYQINKGKKPGPQRTLSPQNELFLTLMKLRLNLNSEFLGHLFGISQSLVTAILSTWIPLLALELKPLIYWPTREEAQHYYPDCFKKYKNVIAIIDCTEVPIQRPSLALANGQIYSFYKGRPTCKLLVACTPVGTVSFVSCAAGGAMSDKRLVKESGILSKFLPQDTVLADRGFNIQELLLPYQVNLVIPPFLKKKKQFSLEDDARTKQVANARIHIERVIGRLKDFDILKAELPLDMCDLFDHIATVICCLVNLQSPIIPLHCQ